MRDSDVLLATKVGDAVGDANISKLWQDHFSTLLNSVQNNKSKTYVCESIKHGLAHADTVVTTAQLYVSVLNPLSWVKLQGSMVWLLNTLSIHTTLFLSICRCYLLAC